MFNTIIVQPLLNILFFITALIPGHDFGIAVILLTVLVRFALWPLAAKQLHSQKALSAIQPEVNRLKKKYEKDPQKFNAAVMELYKEKEVSPFSSCLPTILQLPVLFGFFYVFQNFGNVDFVKIANDSGIMTHIYPFLKNTGIVKSYIESISAINTHMFGVLDLAAIKTIPNLVLGLVAGALQFVQSKMLMPKTQDNDAASAVSKNMTYLFPLLTVYIGYILPAALPLYWTITTLFAIGQQYLVMHRDVEVLEAKKK